MKKINYQTPLKVILIVFIAIILDLLGIGFLALKLVSVPFVPSRNIDDMSDYYTAVFAKWKNLNSSSNDNGRFHVIDITKNSRDEIYRILATVYRMNPRIIGFDVSNIWHEDERVDSQFVSTIQSIPNIILPVELYDKDPDSLKYLPSIFHKQLANKEYAVVSFPETRDILRTYRPQFTDGNKKIDAFGCAIAKFCGANICSLEGDDKVLINYTTLRLSDKDATEGRDFLDLNKQDSTSLALEVNGRIVLVGSTELSSDTHLTPLGYNLSGVMIHAHIINSLIENRSIVSIPIFLRYVLCAILVALTLYWFNNHAEVKRNKSSLWWSIAKYSLVLLLSMILFTGVGTILFCKYCYYVDFAPYTETLILVYILKDKKINFKNRKND